MIHKAASTPRARIIDVGGGASVLVDRLLASGFETIAVLDISETALERAKSRLGNRAGLVQWLAGDITRIGSLGEFDVWHDRAVFHFLTREEDRRRYVSLAERTLPSGGHLILATFAPGGPTQCSGLDVCRYDAKALALIMGPSFELVEWTEETHQTPWDTAQEFVYCLFRQV